MPIGRKITTPNCIIVIVIIMIRSNYPPIHSNGSPSDRGGIIFDLDLHTPETLAVSPPQYEISSLGRPYETFPNYVPLPKACCGSNIVVVGIVVGMMMMILYHFLFHLLHLSPSPIEIYRHVDRSSQNYAWLTRVNQQILGLSKLGIVGHIIISTTNH